MAPQTSIPTVGSLLPGRLKDALLGSSAACRFTTGVFWNLLANLLVRVLGVLSNIVAARLLGVAGFGELGIIQNTINTFWFISGTSMGITATKHVSEYRIPDPCRAGRLLALAWIVSIVFGLVSTLTIFSGADWISIHLLRSPHLSDLIRLSSCMILFGALRATQQGILNGMEEFRILAYLYVLDAVLSLAGTCVLTYYYGLNGAVISLVLVGIVTWALNSLCLHKAMVRHNLHLNWVGLWAERAVLWRFSLPHLLGTLQNMPGIWLCNGLLVRQPGGLEQMGIFSAVYRWREVILFLPGAISSVAAAIHSERLGVGDYKTVNNLLWWTVGLVFAVALVGVMSIGFFGPLILQLYGKEFVGEGSVVLWVLLCGGMMQAIGVSFSNLTTSAGWMWSSLFVDALRNVFLIGGTLFLVKYGALGLASSHTVAAVVGMFALYILARKILHRKGRLP